MQSTCSYCHQFDPVLKQISEQTGIAVFPYSLDGRGDAAFPAALPAGPDVMVEFLTTACPSLPHGVPGQRQHHDDLPDVSGRGRR